MRVADLFCGIGGLALGFSRMGCRVIGYDVSPSRVATFRFNGIGDAHVMDLMVGHPRGRFDVVVGGPPCQPWSVLNLKMRGPDHPLYPCMLRMIRLIRELRPRAFVIENVPALLSDEKVMARLGRLGEFYRIGQRVIRYSDHGAPTARRRAFILGILRSEGADPEEVFARIPRGPARTVRDAIWDLRDRGPDPAFNHVWPELRTIGRYSDKYGSGRFGWYALRWDEPARSFGNVTRTYILHPDSLDGGETRVISVREALRLMGFPDDYRFPPGIPMGSMYQMVADSVSPEFSRRLASALLSLL